MNRARGHRGIKDNRHRHNQFITLNHLSAAAAREHEGKLAGSFFFLRERLFPARYYREIRRLFYGHKVIRCSPFLLTPSRPVSLLLRPSSLDLSCYPQTRSRPLRRGSISTMIVIHVRYNRKLAAAT